MTLSADGGPYRSDYDHFVRTGEVTQWIYKNIPINFGSEGEITPPDDRDWQLISTDIDAGMAVFCIEKGVHTAQA